MIDGLMLSAARRRTDTLSPPEALTVAAPERVNVKPISTANVRTRENRRYSRQMGRRVLCRFSAARNDDANHGLGRPAAESLQGRNPWDVGRPVRRALWGF